MKSDRAKVLRNNAFSLTKRYEPARVAAVRVKRGDAAANKMSTAIALDAARKTGVKISK